MPWKDYRFSGKIPNLVAWKKYKRMCAITTTPYVGLRMVLICPCTSRHTSRQHTRLWRNSAGRADVPLDPLHATQPACVTACNSDWCVNSSRRNQIMAHTQLYSSWFIQSDWKDCRLNGAVAWKRRPSITELLMDNIYIHSMPVVVAAKLVCGVDCEFCLM